LGDVDLRVRRQHIPGFAAHINVEYLVMCVAPWRMLLVSATEDTASRDAAEIVDRAQQVWEAMVVEGRLEHRRYEAGHIITPDRFELIVDWLAACAQYVTS
jgi:hypothetical protein